jgi:hypothetical protein
MREIVPKTVPDGDRAEIHGSNGQPGRSDGPRSSENVSKRDGDDSRFDVRIAAAPLRRPGFA